MDAPEPTQEAESGTKPMQKPSLGGGREVGSTILNTLTSKDVRPLVVLLTKIATQHDNELWTITGAVFRTFMEPVGFPGSHRVGVQVPRHVNDMNTKEDAERTRQLAEVAPPFLQVWATLVDRARKTHGLL